MILKRLPLSPTRHAEKPEMWLVRESAAWSSSDWRSCGAREQVVRYR